jgi:transposase
MRLRWSRKVAKKAALQRNEQIRALWRAKGLYWQLHQLVFLDESACLPRTGDRNRGWSPVGLPRYDTQLLSRSKRWSVLPAMMINGYLAEPLIIEGGVTMEVFGEWFEHKLLPQLTPGQIIVMDSASIHHSEIVRALCQGNGLQLEYLPLYSPDLNPIEQSFNVLKAWVRKHAAEAGMFKDFGVFMAHAIREVRA